MIWSRAGVLVVALVLLGCRPHSDIVARFDAGRDAGKDSGPAPPEPDPLDAGPEPEPMDAGPLDAGPDDAEPAPDDSGMPPPLPRVCPAETCSTTLAQRDAFCSAARPAAVVLGDSCDAESRPRFGFAICSCSDLVTNSDLVIAALDGTPRAASVAVNAQLRFGSTANIDGSIYVSGRYSSAMPPTLSGSLNVDSTSPCVCDDPNLLDMRPLLEARALDNDNASAQLTASSLNNITSQTLVLECGRYYFERVFAEGSLQIEARGRVALFIAGELGVAGGLTLTLQSGASAEIFVGGNVRVGGPLELSTSTDGNRVLLAVDGTGTIDLAGAIVDGSIYAPRAEIVTRGPFELNGALFVERANFGDTARIRYQPIPASRASCAP